MNQIRGEPENDLLIRSMPIGRNRNEYAPESEQICQRMAVATSRIDKFLLFQKPRMGFVTKPRVASVREATTGVNAIKIYCLLAPSEGGEGRGVRGGAKTFERQIPDRNFFGRCTNSLAPQSDRNPYAR